MAASAEEPGAPRYILIPLHGTGEAVAVDVDRLPSDHGDLLDILKGEQAPLDCWLHLARAYFKQGNTAAFLDILSEGTSPDAERVYETSRHERIAMLNALGAHYTGLGRVARRQKRDEVLIKVVDFYNKAARISSEAVATWKRDEVLIKVIDFYNKAARISSEAVATWVGKGEETWREAGWGQRDNWGVRKVGDCEGRGAWRRRFSPSPSLPFLSSPRPCSLPFSRNSLLFSLPFLFPNPSPIPFPMTGQLQLVKGEVNQAEEMFSLALAGAPDYVPALLGKACVLFHKAKFQDALNLYKVGGWVGGPLAALLCMLPSSP
ncbi:unnamed protein product [Closterium sp. Yama58-4]|nr:unnamed protein product [Closterium sp. Yama58-4]